MSKALAKAPPPDQREREQALDASRSILVQAPAGSGKTDLLTKRFLRLLGEVNAPGEIVAITFTNAAAAEMRHRILSELEKAAARDPAREAANGADEFSMEALAARALERSRLMGWNLLDTPAQLRISTIDSFCRELALQQPLLSGLGGGIGINEQPQELYRRAVRRTLERIGDTDEGLSQALEALMLWHDNNWKDLENLLVEMLAQRDRWMHDFVLRREPDWDELRAKLERPFANAIREAVAHIEELMGRVPGARGEALELARFACEQSGGKLHRELAEIAEFPCGPCTTSADLEGTRDAYVCLANLVLTQKGTLRSRVNKLDGFPASFKMEISRMMTLIAALRGVPGLEEALGSMDKLPPARYTEDEWEIVRACFTLLRHAAGELHVAFAEAGAVDFTEVAQIALRMLKAEDGLPSEAAMAVSDGIRHLLIDEFQDTSRRQHQLLAGLAAAWPEREGRTCFAVGDPMQSIYFFREADAELFPRVRDMGLEIHDAEPLRFEFVPLSANFRTAPALVEWLNESFARIFAEHDGSGIEFSPASAAREQEAEDERGFELHLEFAQRARRGGSGDDDAAGEADDPHDAQTAEIVELIRERWPVLDEKRARGEKYRIAVLGRARSALAPIAKALREATIPLRAVELEKLGARPEVRDALSLGRALLCGEDRMAWLGLLRAPWCGLALADLHKLVSDDDEHLLARPVRELAVERLHLIGKEAQGRVRRVLDAVDAAGTIRAALPNAALGTWLEQVWLRLGGASCVDAAARVNLDLLWSCLDGLPNGEQDLLGPALDAALEKLTAQPDPEASSDCGVQLMTIHKSKGLEFEVVIVPELQAKGGRGGRKLLSWLERGLAEPNESGEITEFLVAPLQTKGADRGQAKAWVDRVRSEREAQEDRRVLYVAATRAREELHLFARPECKAESNGALTLCEPKGSLLATAWPALAYEARARFEEWKVSVSQHAAEHATVEAIAASAASGNVMEMPPLEKPVFIRRLPADYLPAESGLLRRRQDENGSEVDGARLYERHEGGLRSRALGIAVHVILEELARLRVTLDWDAARLAVEKIKPRVGADLRALGLDQRAATEIAAKAFESAMGVSRDEVGKWILSPQMNAASEVRWVGVIDGSTRTVQADRVFRAGHAPLTEGNDCWWIVDYKTYDDTRGTDPATALSRLREVFAPQLEAYATVLRNLHGRDIAICAGLYYARMLKFDWWEM
jgi:ATP-dependent exoDNAse (exonuclease V) beta subunit